MFKAVANYFRHYPVAAPIVTGVAAIGVSRMLAPDSTGRTVAMVAGVAGIALGGARAVGVLPTGSASAMLRGNPSPKGGYVVEVVSRDWGGFSRSGWRPAAAGSLNQTHQSDERASTSPTLKEAREFARNLLGPGGADRVRVVRAHDGATVLEHDNSVALRDNPTLRTRHGSYSMKAACTGRGKAAAALAGQRWHGSSGACAATSAGRVLGARSWPEGSGGLTKARAAALTGARRAEAEIHTAARGLAQARGMSQAKALAEVRARHSEVRRAMGR